MNHEALATGGYAMKLQTAGKDFRRIVTDMGSVVGFASRLTNGKWCALDYHGVRITRAGVFDKPRQALKWFESEER